MKTIVVLIERLGPYHVARLSALAQDAKVFVIQIVEEDSTYGWNRVGNDHLFECRTLFSSSHDYSGTSSSVIKEKLFRLLDSVDVGAIAIGGWSELWALQALSWCKANGRCAVLMSDSQEIDSERNWFQEHVKSLVVRNFDRALVAGKPHVRYAENLGVENRFIRTGYDVVDNDYFAQHALRARMNAAHWRRELGLPPRYFLACGRLVAKKNVRGLLLAYGIYRSLAQDNAWGLVIVGDGPEKATAEHLIRELGLCSSVSLCGFRQYDELPIFYGLSDAFVHVSTTEQWGLVVNEAMACALPVVVSSRCGCAEDLVRDGLNGFRVDPYDHTQIAHAMVKLSENADRRLVLGAMSRTLISGWSPRQFAANLISLSTMSNELIAQTVCSSVALRLLVLQRCVSHEIRR